MRFGNLLRVLIISNMKNIGHGKLGTGGYE